MGKIAKNYVYNLLYQILLLVVPLIMAPYLARTIGADGTGEYAYVNSVVSIITTFSLLGIYNYGNRQIAYTRDNKEALNKTFWQIMSLRFLLCTIGTAIYVSVTLLVGKYTFLFLIYYSYFFGYCLDCTWLFVGVEDMKWAVIKNVFIKIFATIMIFIFVHDVSDTWIYVLIQGGSILLGNLLGYTQIRLYVGKPMIDFSNLKKDIVGSLLLFLPGIAALIYLQCDKIMIEFVTQSTKQVSFYDYSEKIITLPLTVVTVISTVLMPRIANCFKNNKKEEIQDLLSKTSNLTVWIAFPLMFGIFCISDKFIPWYLGNEFTPTITTIKILSPLVLCNSLIGISGSQYFVGTNQTKILTISQTSAAVLNVILNIFLIQYYGFVGAAIATLACHILLVIVQYAVFLRQVKLRHLLANSVKYCLFSVVMGFIILGSTFSMSSTIFTTIIQIVIGVCVYLLLCLTFRDKQLKFVFGYIKNKFKGKDNE